MQSLVFVPIFVFLVQIRRIWDKIHHMMNLPDRQAGLIIFLLPLEKVETNEVVESQKVGRETLYINKELIEILK